MYECVQFFFCENIWTSLVVIISLSENSNGNNNELSGNPMRKFFESNFDLRANVNNKQIVAANFLFLMKKLNLLI